MSSAASLLSSAAVPATMAVLLLLEQVGNEEPRKSPASNDPGLALGMVVRVTSYRSRTLWPPYLRMNSGPFSGLPSGPSLRCGPWHMTQLARYATRPASLCSTE